jgi:HSP20 family protein
MANWDIFREMDHLRRELDDVFRGFGMGRFMAPGLLAGPEAGEYPYINLSEDENNIFVEALVPGLEPQEIDLNVMKGTLTISGERKESQTGKKDLVWHRRERGTGKFLRSVELPVSVDTERVDAQYRNGVLTVTLPKTAEAKRKRIEIKSR